MQPLAQTLVFLLEVYAVAGVVFAVGFVTRGVQTIDPAASESGWGFRLLLVPGVAALWPLLLTRWIRGARR